MIKLVALLRRRSDLSPHEFRAYYVEQHVPLFRRTLPADMATVVKRYTHNHAVLFPVSEGGAPFDCVTEFEFDDLDGLRRWTSWYYGPGAQVLRDDENNFVDLSQRVVVVTEPLDFALFDS